MFEGLPDPPFFQRGQGGFRKGGQGDYDTIT